MNPIAIGSKKQKHSSAFKAKVAIEALQERESFSELSKKKYGIHSNMISRWKKEFLDHAPELFDKSGHDKKEDTDLEMLYAKIGQLEMEREFFKKLEEVGSVTECIGMVNREEPLSILCQCNLVSVNQGSFYYKLLAGASIT